MNKSLGPRPALERPCSGAQGEEGVCVLQVQLHWLQHKIASDLDPRGGNDRKRKKEEEKWGKRGSEKGGAKGKWGDGRSGGNGNMRERRGLGGSRAGLDEWAPARSSQLAPGG